MKKRLGFVSNSSSSSFIIMTGWKTDVKNIRSRKIKSDDYGEERISIEYQKFKRPYFFNLIGKKKWIYWYIDWYPKNLK